ncbi:MAG TPA: MarR family transcriptional regulator [Ktedonobacterales bacterium]|nr:MarR family transcriptional regulator [Ktedonobacterales bacterium]
MDAKQLQDLFGAFIHALALYQPGPVPAGFSTSVSKMLALLTLADEAPMPQHMLAERVQLDKSTVSRLVRELERRGWVTRERDRDDTRIVQIGLTESGQQEAASLAQHLNERHARLLAALTEDEQEALAHGLSALIRALKPV